MIYSEYITPVRFSNFKKTYASFFGHTNKDSNPRSNNNNTVIYARSVVVSSN